MPPRVPLLSRIDVDQSDVDVMKPGPWLAAFVRLLTGQSGRRKLTQLLVYQREKLIRSRWITLLNLGENLRNVSHEDQDNVTKQVIPLVKELKQCCAWAGFSDRSSTSISGKEASRMRDCNQGRFRQQIRFLRRQFLQDGELPFSNVLSAEVVASIESARRGLE